MITISFVAASIVLSQNGYAFSGHPLELRPEYGHYIRQCAGSKPSDKHIWLFGQWPLGPEVNTKEKNEAAQFKQEENQTAIYRQLEKWISQGQVKTVLAEGCEGKIDSFFNQKFNGWSIGDLRSASNTAVYDKIVTSVPLKLKAKFGSQLNVQCADDRAEAKKMALAFSDARRLLSTDSSRIKSELQNAVSRIKKAIEARNKKMIETILKLPQKGEIVLVVGGAQVADLVSRLETKNLTCFAIQPVGYSDDTEKLFTQINERILHY